MSVTFFIALGILTAGDIAMRMKAEPKTVAEFYEAYKRYGLWLPPKDAKLVVRRLHDEDNYSILVAERTVISPAILRDLHGPSTEWLSARFRTIKPDVKIIDEHSWHGAHDLLFLAAMGHHLGWTDFSKAAFEKAKRTPGYLTQIADWEHDSVGFIIGLIREVAWDQNVEKLCDPKKDRKKVWEILHSIARDDSRFQLFGLQRLVSDLEFTIQHRPTPTNKAEEAIDRLVEWTGELDWRRTDSTRPWQTRSTYDELAMMGFDAVPALIAHLDDRRLTRSQHVEIFNLSISKDVYRVGDVCAALLAELSAGEVHPWDTFEPVERKQDAEKWFARAKEIGEERWYLTCISAKYEPGEGNYRAFATRFPKSFVRWYRGQMSLPKDIDNRRPVTALVHAPTLKSERASLLLLALESQGVNKRWGALLGLSAVDRDLLIRHLPAFFRSLNRENVKERMEYQFREECELVLRTDNVECRKSLLESLQFATPGERIQFVDWLIDWRMDTDKDRFAKEWKILNPLWDDGTIRRRVHA